MAYYVSSRTMLQSSKCSHAYSCLKTGDCPSVSKCEVAEGNEYMVCLKNSESLEACPYRFGVGRMQFCTCPTFVAVHRQKKDMRSGANYPLRRRPEKYNNQGELYGN